MGQGFTWGYPPIPLDSETEKTTVKGINFSFIFFLFYNDLMRMSSARPLGGSSIHCEEDVLSETSGWFIDPLEELEVTLLTLEVETAWVLLGT